MVLFHRIRVFFSKLLRNYPEFLFKLNYKRVTGRWINTRNPKTLYDKIVYMAFHTDTSIWTRLADKVAVREYVESKGYGENLPLLYGVWFNVDDIDYVTLPSSFVLKTNNASTTNIFVKDKSAIDVNVINKQLTKWLKWEYGVETAQPHYSRIIPKVLAEEFLIDEETSKLGKSLIDYKFYCVNGTPVYVQVIADRKLNTHDFKIMLYDMDWVAYPNFISNIHDRLNTTFSKPTTFEYMKKMASDLATGLQFVRVDLYEINKKTIFGEMTFTPGLDTFSDEFMRNLGTLIC